jgi:hypothetical protein
MNIIEKIKAMWAVKMFFNIEIKEAKKMNGTKPGYKTTEFWIQVAVQLGSLWGAVAGFVPPKYAAIISVVGASVYNIGQIVLKAVAKIQDAKSESTTVTTTQPVTTITTP